MAGAMADGTASALSSPNFSECSTNAHGWTVKSRNWRVLKPCASKPSSAEQSASTSLSASVSGGSTCLPVPRVAWRTRRSVAVCRAVRSRSSAGADGPAADTPQDDAMNSALLQTCCGAESM
eukprot:scaffold20333_cov64-Phaeocystis_antarctica.AAC.9